MFSDCITLCSMSATQFTSQWLKKMTLKLSNTLLTMISTQQWSQLIRMSGWFIRFIMIIFRRLSSCNQFSFTFKYDLKASYIISSNNESDNYVLFTDSENNCDTCNFWEPEHRDYSQSSVKNWISHKQQSHHQSIYHLSCCSVLSLSFSFLSLTNIDSLLYDQKSLKSVWNWQRVIWVKDYVADSLNINERYSVITDFFDSHNCLITTIWN